MLIVLPMDSPPIATIQCVDGCGNFTDVETAEAKWVEMHIRKGFRCPRCHDLLKKSGVSCASEPTTAVKKL